MVTDDERREVARRLRGDLENARSRGHYCNDSETVRYICDILGLHCSRCPHPWAGLEALADLIEPPARCPHYMHPCCRTDAAGDYIDRDALLELTDEMKATAKEAESIGFVFNWRLYDFAHRIREALGIQDA